MWTKEQRAIYRRNEDRYPSNLTDAEWELRIPIYSGRALRQEAGRRYDLIPATIPI